MEKTNIQKDMKEEYVMKGHAVRSETRDAICTTYEPNILECEFNQAIWKIKRNESPRSDTIPVKLFYNNYWGKKESR